jgi:catechol 2,3-dioxygenase-like lactoylglutathione lyase family enzyme
MASGAASLGEEQAALPHLGIRAIDISVADIDAAIDWYRPVLPLSELRRFAIPRAAFGTELAGIGEGEVQVAVLATPTTLLHFMQFPSSGRESEPPPVTGPGYTHMCIQSAATDPALGKLMAQGLRMVSRCDERGVDLGGYGVRYAYGRDREGRMLEVEILDRPSRGDLGWLTHIANVAHDHSAMMAFYARLLGKQPYRTTAQADRKTLDEIAGIDGIGILGGWLRVRNLDIEVWNFTSPATPAPQERRRLNDIGYGAFALEVTDLDAEMRRLGALGIELVGPEVDFGGWRTRYAADPEGNLFSVQQCAGAPATESAMQFDPLGF